MASPIVYLHIYQTNVLYCKARGNGKGEIGKGERVGELIGKGERVGERVERLGKEGKRKGYREEERKR